MSARLRASTAAAIVRDRAREAAKAKKAAQTIVLEWNAQLGKCIDAALNGHGSVDIHGPIFEGSRLLSQGLRISYLDYSQFTRYRADFERKSIARADMETRRLRRAATQRARLSTLLATKRARFFSALAATDRLQALSANRRAAAMQKFQNAFDSCEPFDNLYQAVFDCSLVITQHVPELKPMLDELQELGEKLWEAENPDEAAKAICLIETDFRTDATVAAVPSEPRTLESFCRAIKPRECRKIMPLRQSMDAWRIDWHSPVAPSELGDDLTGIALLWLSDVPGQDFMAAFEKRILASAKASKRSTSLEFWSGDTQWLCRLQGTSFEVALTPQQLCMVLRRLSYSCDLSFNELKKATIDVSW